MGTTKEDGRVTERVLQTFAVATVMVAMVLVAATGTAGAVDSISSCREINASNAPVDGGVEVTTDLTYTGSEACIEVTTGNVTVFGQNHTISGTGTGYGFWANGSTPSSANIDNVTAVNLTAEGLSSGFVFNNTDELFTPDPDSTSGVRDVVARNNANAGILERENDFLVIEDSNFSRNTVGIYSPSFVTASLSVRNNNVTFNSAAGIRSAADNADYLDNYVVQNDVGMDLTAGTFTSVEVGRNIVRSNTTGITIISGGSGNNVHDNVVSGGSAGIIQRGGSGHTVVDNTVTGVSGPRLRLSQGANATITDLDIGVSTAAGTTLDAEARNVTLRNVSSPPSDPSEEQNISRFVNVTPTASSSFFNVTFQYKNSDLSGVTESRLDVWKNNVSSGWTELGTGPATDAGANEIQYNVTNVGSVFAPLANTMATNVTGCRVIDSSGLYQLNQSITNATTADCIDIETSDVTFDGNNHFINGVDNTSAAAGPNIGINISGPSTLSNVTVRDVNVTRWGDGGVFVEDTSLSDGVNLTDINATRNGASGIDILTSAGIVNITDSVLTDNGAKGVSIDSSGAPATLKNNLFRSNSDPGDDASVRLDNDGNYTFINNTFVDTNAEAIRAGGLTTANTVTFNDDTFENTFATAFDAGGDATYTGQDVTFRSSVATTTVDFTFRNVNLEETSATPPDPSNETNVSAFINATKSDSFTADSKTYLNVTFDYDPANVPAGTEGALDVWKYNGTWTELGTGPATDAGANEIQYNVTNVGSVFAPLANTTATGGGLNTINSCLTINASNRPADGLVELGSDITNGNVQSCINVTVSNVVLDGQNHTVDGLDDDSGSIGVNVTNASTALTNVTVRNLTVTNWGNGIEYASADDGKITDNNASGNDRGIVLSVANGNNVTDNMATGNNILGIDIGSSDNNKVMRNTVTENGDGIFLFQSNGNIIRDNKATGSTANDGISLDQSSNNNVTGNNVTGNLLAGIRLTSSSNNNVTNNTANSNFNGIELTLTSDNNDFVNNTARNNGGADIRIDQSSNNVVENLDIGASTAPNTTLDFTGNNLTLSGTSSPPADPSGEQNIGRFVEASNTSATAFLNITFEYTDSDVSSVDETKLDVWKNNGTWTELGGSVDAAANEIRYNITNFGSVFAPLADTGVTGAPRAGGECVNRRNLSRGEEERECPRDRTIGRGGSRDELDRRTGRRSETSRRDRGRGSIGRGR